MKDFLEVGSRLQGSRNDSAQGGLNWDRSWPDIENSFEYHYKEKGAA